MVFNKTTNVYVRPSVEYPPEPAPYDLMQAQMANCHLSQALYHERVYSYQRAIYHKQVLRNAKARLAKESKAEGIEEGKKIGFQEAMELQQLRDQSIELGRQLERNGGSANTAASQMPRLIEGRKAISHASRHSGAASATALKPTSNVNRFLEAQSSEVSRASRPAHRSASIAHAPPPSSVAQFVAAQGSQIPRSGEQTVRPAANAQAPQSNVSRFLAAQGSQVSNTSQRTVRPAGSHHPAHGSGRQSTPYFGYGDFSHDEHHRHRSSHHGVSSTISPSDSPSQPPKRHRR